jgi:hypothetical protein
LNTGVNAGDGAKLISWKNGSCWSTPSTRFFTRFADRNWKPIRLIASRMRCCAGTGSIGIASTSCGSTTVRDRFRFVCSPTAMPVRYLPYTVVTGVSHGICTSNGTVTCVPDRTSSRPASCTFWNGRSVV